MNKPVSYLQTDPRWKAVDYSAKGEKTTIGASGCGPTAMAMVLATWADPSVTPKTECAWALAHGYKALRSGTYYGYFPPAAKRYGLSCYRLNFQNLYGDSKSAYHAQVKDAVDRGDLVIACMGKGNWTRSGHYVLVYGIQGNTVFINDPASTKESRVRGDWSLFKQQVKYYWAIERPETIPTDDDEEEITVEKFLEKLTDEQAYELMRRASRYASTLPEPAWSQADGHWQKGKEDGITDGSAPERPAKRCEVITLIYRILKKAELL